MKETVTIYYKSQLGGNKKLDRYLKKNLKKKKMSFHQIDKLGIICEVYNRLEEHKTNTNQTYIFSVVFTNHFLKDMEIAVKYTPAERLSNLIFGVVEEKLKSQLTNKSLNEKNMLEIVLKKDLEQVFTSFLNSGFLLKSDSWLEAGNILRTGTKNWKTAKKYCPTSTQKVVNSLLRLNRKEEVLELVK